MIIINKHVPAKVIKSLNNFGTVVLFETNTITYPQISGHPDIFFCAGNDKLVAAPNTPDNYLSLLKKEPHDFSVGELPVGKIYPDSAHYNAVITNHFLIHNLKITDPVILNTFSDLETIHVPQGYSRCSLLPLKKDRFITSDRGIMKILEGKGLEVLYMNPSEILLPGYNHGFFGGTAGIINDKVFFLGSLSKLQDGDKAREFLTNSGYEIIELTNDHLFDGGTILFL